MRVIFLDIDGVLNSTDYFKSRRQYQLTADDDQHSAMIDTEAVERLNRITDATGALLVLSSTWRIAMPTPVVYDALRRRGVTAPMIGCTMSHESKTASGLWNVLSRDGAILDWVETVKPNGWVAIDDEDMRGPLGDSGQVLTCDGLKDEHVDEAMRKLCIHRMYRRKA